MKNRRMNVLGVTVISTIAIGALGFIGGCKSQEVLRDRPLVPPPSNQEPSNPPLAAPATLAAPVVAAPVLVQPVLAPAPAVKLPAAKLAPAPEQTVPK